MVYKVFSIRDQKSEIFNPPFFKTTHGEAERDFRTTVNDDKTMLWKYPDDFDLYYLGDYDGDKGLMKPLDTPQHLLKAVACVQRETTPGQ